jgi:hypothetical protein
VGEEFAFRFLSETVKQARLDSMNLFRAAVTQIAMMIPWKIYKQIPSK